MKKIIFFDADGTLWYPKSTKYKEKPWWIYEHPQTSKGNVNKHLELIPGVKGTLRLLKKRGIILALVSQLPYNKEKATKLLKQKLKYFGLTGFFDEVCPSFKISGRLHTNAKDKSILQVLRRYNIPKAGALMVGDSYVHDYLAAKRSGIDAVLVGRFKHTKDDIRYARVKRKINSLKDILEYLQ